MKKITKETNLVGMLRLLIVLFLFSTVTPVFASNVKGNGHLPKGKPSAALNAAFNNYLNAIKSAGTNQHSIMILQHGKVLASAWMNEGAPEKEHAMWSVSKTFTSTAVGFAIAEGKLKLTDKVISFFPDKLPAEVSENLKALEIRHLLTMNSGHDTDPTGAIRNSGDNDWIKSFFATPLTHKPGTYFVYNSLGTYILSAIVQKVTGQKVFDYLTPRLFKQLGITGIHWDESPAGINCGGWGLYLKTEDMAKMGQFLLQKGKWNGKQLIPAKWIEEASKKQVESFPSWSRTIDDSNADWGQGYGYQMWRCRHNAFRADGANGQYIIMIPAKDAVIITTANRGDMPKELEELWNFFLPVL